MAVEVRARMGVAASDPLYRRGFVSRSARRANGDTVQIYGDFRGEIEAVRKVLMRTARRTGMPMFTIAQLKGWTKPIQQQEEEEMTAQLARVETETLELPSLLGSTVPEPEDIVDLIAAMEAFNRDVLCGNALLVEPVSLETALAVAANAYRWACFWVVRHPDPIVREGFAANLAEAAPLRASVRGKAERMIAKHRGLNG
jgi:hypothetical protein